MPRRSEGEEQEMQNAGHLVNVRSVHPPGPSANPVYRAGQVTGEFVRGNPAASLLLGFGIGYAAGMLLMRPGNLSRS
jgi:hypothetical protein